MVLGADEEEKDGDRDTKRGEWVKEENGKEGRKGSTKEKLLYSRNGEVMSFIWPSSLSVFL